MLKLAQNNRYPMTTAQRPFLNAHRHNALSTVDTIAHYLDIKGSFNEQTLITAIKKTLAETDIFSASVINTHPAQLQLGHHTLNVEQINFSHKSKPKLAAKDWMQQDIDTPINFHNDPLTRHALIKVSEHHIIWYTRTHHMLIDGYGMMLYEQRCCEWYAHLTRNQSLNKPFRPFSDYIAEEHHYLQDKKNTQDKNFWSAYLKPKLTLPITDPSYDPTNADLVCHQASFSESFSQQLQHCSQELGIGWPDLVVALTSLYLHKKELNENEQLVWVPFMNRWGSVAASIPGLMVNILPYRSQCSANQTLAEYLHNSARNLRTLYQHGRYRVEDIQTDMGLAQEQTFFMTPFINVMPFESPSLTGCTVEHQVLASGTADGLNITFRGDGTGNYLMVFFDADKHSYSETELTRHAKALPHFLTSLFKDSFNTSQLNENIRALLATQLQKL